MTEIASTKPTTRKLKSALDLATSIAIIAVAVVLVSQRLSQPKPPARPKMTVPAEPIDLPPMPKLGSSAAKTVIVEFADFQCPFCVRFNKESMPTLEKEYLDNGKAQFAYAHYPVASHAFALEAATAATCAAQQGKFWQFHGTLYEKGNLSEAAMEAYAREVGLDMPRYSACRSQQEPRDAIKANAEIFRKQFGILGTPAFVIGTLEADGRLRVHSTIDGAKPVDEFRRALDEAIKSAGQ